MGLTLHTKVSTISTLNAVDPAIWYLVHEIYTLSATLCDMQAALDSVNAQYTHASDTVLVINSTARLYDEIDLQFELSATVQTRRSDYVQFIRVEDTNKYTRHVLKQVVSARQLFNSICN